MSSSRYSGFGIRWRHLVKNSASRERWASRAPPPGASRRAFFRFCRYRSSSASSCARFDGFIPGRCAIGPSGAAPIPSDAFLPLAAEAEEAAARVGRAVREELRELAEEVGVVLEKRRHLEGRATRGSGEREEESGRGEVAGGGGAGRGWGGVGARLLVDGLDRLLLLLVRVEDLEEGLVPGGRRRKEGGERGAAGGRGSGWRVGGRRGRGRERAGAAAARARAARRARGGGGGRAAGGRAAGEGARTCPAASRTAS